MRKYILLTMITASVLVTSCNETAKTHVFYLDCTNSTILSDGDRYASNFYKALRKKIAKEVKDGETILIYPIHAKTLSAAPLGEWEMPIKKDINYKIDRKKKLSEIISQVEEKLSTMPLNLRSSTNIFPVFNKLKRMSNNGFMQVTIISDMIQDNSLMSFPNQFIAIDKKVVKELALTRYNKIKDDISINGQHISILVPGTEKGNKYGDSFNNKVNIFWETFFNEAGANVSIADLS